LPDKEPRGAWKKRAEEQTSYKKLRDEKKRKKTVAPDENSQAYLLLGVSAKGLRGVKVNLRGKSKSDSKEVHIPLETRAKFGTNILQSCQTGEDTVVTYAATSNGHIEVFKVKMTPIN
jgi:hypothetical protein